MRPRCQYRVQQSLGNRVLRDKRNSACGKGGLHRYRIVADGDHNHLDGWQRLRDQTTGIQTIQAWHVDVEHDDIGLEAARGFEYLIAVSDTPNHMTVLSDQPFDGSDEGRVIVSDQDAGTRR